MQSFIVLSGPLILHMLADDGKYSFILTKAQESLDKECKHDQMGFLFLGAPKCWYIRNCPTKGAPFVLH